MNIDIGTEVKTNVDWPEVPKGTHGFIVEDYGTGVMVAWDLPVRPYPRDMFPYDIGLMYAINPKCPLRDGFDKETELHYLDEVEIHGVGVLT